MMKYLIVVLMFVAFFSAAFAQELSSPDLIPKKQGSESGSPKPSQDMAPPTVSATGSQDVSSGSLSPGPTNTGTPPQGLVESLPMGMIVIGMLIGGFLLLVIEVAIIPGFGLFGIKGLILIFIGLILAYWQLDSRTAVLYTLISMLSLIGLGFWFVFIFPYTSFGKKFILQTRMTSAEGYTAVQDFSKYVGMEGTAICDLRPSGVARLGEERMDVVSDGEFIPRGTRVKAVRIRSNNIVVIPLDKPQAP